MNFSLSFSERIEDFIDENKSLMRRMYGDFIMSTEYGPPKQNTEYGLPRQRKKKRDTTDNLHTSDEGEESYLPGVPDYIGPPPGFEPDPVPMTTEKGESYFDHWRAKRQTNQSYGGRNISPRSIQDGPSTGPTTAEKPNVGPVPPNEPKTGRYAINMQIL